LRTPLLGLCLLAGPGAAASAGTLPDMTLWVVQPPGQLVALDLPDFQRVGGVRIPPAAFNDPSRISVNGRGQFLVQLDDDHLWVWNGAHVDTLPVVPVGASRTTSRTNTMPLRRWLLGDDGNSLFVLEGETSKQDPAADTAVTPLVVRETTLSQKPRGVVLATKRAPCWKPTDLSLEPCPDPSLWAVGGVVRGCFVLSHWEPDPRETVELPAAWCRNTLYASGPKAWRASDLGGWGDRPLLDMSLDGSEQVWDEREAGSSSSMNEDSDRAVLATADTAVVIFDEWSTFGNRDYDVSFFASDARISPGGRRIAYTVKSTWVASTDVRVSAEGHADSLVLASIRRSLADLPLVDVVEVGAGVRRLQRIAHAELVGWASDSELLVVQKRRVVAVDVRTGTRRPSGIEVRTAADAFAVWR